MHLPHLRFLLFAFICLLLCLLKLIVSRPLSILYTLLAWTLSSLNIMILQAQCHLATVQATVTGLIENTGKSEEDFTLKEQFSLFMCCPVKELSFLLFGCLYDKRENTF